VLLVSLLVEAAAIQMVEALTIQIRLLQAALEAAALEADMLAPQALVI
jgi:hypothetical protein|tara:strand:- start:255 stop:398 length:144 start_codon:yes stop_codon:yes gene_type:complete